MAHGARRKQPRPQTAATTTPSSLTGRRWWRTSWKAGQSCHLLLLADPKMFFFFLNIHTWWTDHDDHDHRCVSYHMPASFHPHPLEWVGGCFAPSLGTLEPGTHIKRGFPFLIEPVYCVWNGTLVCQWQKKHGDMMMTQFSYLWTTPQNRKETLRFSKIMPWILDFVATIEMSLLPFVAPFHVYLKHKKITHDKS